MKRTPRQECAECTQVGWSRGKRATAVSAFFAAGLLLAACGSKLTSVDLEACEAVKDLTVASYASAWNDAFALMTNADSADLREIGNAFNTGTMLSSDTNDGLPYQDRAMRICG